MQHLYSTHTNSDNRVQQCHLVLITNNTFISVVLIPNPFCEKQQNGNDDHEEEEEWIVNDTDTIIGRFLYKAI